jgi:hypothetical protein
MTIVARTRQTPVKRITGGSTTLPETPLQTSVALGPTTPAILIGRHSIDIQGGESTFCIHIYDALEDFTYHLEGAIDGENGPWAPISSQTVTVASLTAGVVNAALNGVFFEGVLRLRCTSANPQTLNVKALCK